jgi:hypothetical protein
LPICRRDSRHAVQTNRTLPACTPQSTVADWFLHPGLLDSFIPESASELSSDAVPAKLPDQLHRLPISGGSRLTDNHKTRFDSRHALGCGLIAVTSRTLSQSARVTRPFELLLAYSIAGLPCRCNHRFRPDYNWPTAYAIDSGNLAANKTSNRCLRNG